ncbi:hypothetical protein EDB81DRAFT_893361 [Dactylonectria macrodidyma]|uniref:Uncharacterized protein n=1 Tax=Dactylonectria macrodidyma TaxID=307937 RepID=A0A9P9D7P2_9HYPO|nr:hypothetical protein EDB81DRAFT_893361 [Dactylonectria macrodidyma]
MSNNYDIPGLNQAVTQDDILHSRERHNNLPNDSALHTPEKRHRIALDRMFKKHGVGNIYAVHGLHKHFDLEEGHHLVGHIESYQQRNYRWTRALPNNSLDPNNLHGHIFQLTPDNKLCAYEYQVGPLPDAPHDHNAFISEFSDYLGLHKLDSILGLEVLIPQFQGKKVEIVLYGHQMLLCDRELMKERDSSTVTAWLSHPQSNELTDGVHYVIQGDKHETFNKGAPWPDLKSIIEKLQQANFLGH